MKASGDQPLHSGEKGGRVVFRKWFLPGLVALSLIANGVLAYALDTQNESLSNLETELSDVRAESSSLKSRTVALEERPEAEAFDPAEIKQTLGGLTKRLDRMDTRVSRAVTTSELIEMAEAIGADQEADFEHFEECVDDLITISNGASPPDGLVC
jgi:hypothetical protein